MYEGKWSNKTPPKQTRHNRSPRKRKPVPGRRRKRNSWVSTVIFTLSFVITLYAGVRISAYLLGRVFSHNQNQQLSALAVETIPRTTQPSQLPASALPADEKEQQLPPAENSQQTEPDQPLLPQTPELPSEPPAEVAPIRVNFDVLRRESRDIIGWLYCPDTPINYPIMRSKDNLDYIRKLPDGTPNDAGSIYLDYRNGTDFLTGYSVLYGHNMKDDTMFGTLEEYKNQEYFDAHSVLYLVTEKASYRIDPFAGVITYGTSDYYRIPMNRENAQKMGDAAIEKSTFIPAGAPASENWLLLSTCSYEYDDARFILFGALTEIESP